MTDTELAAEINGTPFYITATFAAAHMLAILMMNEVFNLHFS